MKKFIKMVVFVLVILSIGCLVAACQGGGKGDAPTSRGLYLSDPAIPQNAAFILHNTPMDEEDGFISGDYEGRNEDVSDDNPFEDDAASIEEKAIGTLDVEGAASEIYYAEKNQDIFIVIRLSNPDSYEIQSFTLNGVKYANYMFEYGSDLENLILKVNVGDVDGIVNYTLDAIKYIDGTEIKDVALDGNKTVKAGVRTEEIPQVEATDPVVTLTSISCSITLSDPHELIAFSDGDVKLVLYDGENVVETKDIIIGSTNIVFDHLKPNTLYQYAVVAYYDDLSGEGISLHALYKKSAYTDTIVLFKDVATTKSSFSWDYRWSELRTDTSFTKLELYLDNNKIKDLDVTAKTATGLYSARDYTVKAYYTNESNQEEYISITVTTDSKTVPYVDVKNIESTRSEIRCDVEFVNPDSVGQMTKVELYKGETFVKETPVSDHLVFSGLENNTLYTIKFSYRYNIDDGLGEHNETYSMQYPTILSIGVEEIILLNNNVVRLGEELNMRVYFTNPMEIEMTAIYVNGQKVTVVGGDRVESAIIKFVPQNVGLIYFYIDRVDYVFNQSNITQKINSDVCVQYPIFGDLDVEFTPVTSLYYDYSGDGTYFEFENPYDYTVYKINGSTDFLTLGKGQYYYTGIFINSIEYGYDNYGHTSQTFSFNLDDTITPIGECDVAWDFDGEHETIIRNSSPNYQKVSTAEEFLAMTNGYYYLANDIDMRNVTLNKQIDFSGVLVGNGHKIRGLHNVIDTSNTNYYNIFKGECSSWTEYDWEKGTSTVRYDYYDGGTIYDVSFTELYISINGTAEKQVTILPVGGCRLINCSIRGDIVGNEYVTVNDIIGIDDSVSYNVNVTINDKMETRKHTGTTLEKNENVEVAEDGILYFTFPNGKKYLLGSFATDMTVLSISEDVIAIGNGAFKNCNQITEIYMSGNTLCGDAFGVCPLKKATVSIQALNGMPIETRASIEELTVFGTGEICENCFCDYDNSFAIQSVVLKNGVTSIGRDAFYGCTSLASVTFGEDSQLTSIESGTFFGCTSLTSVTIPDSVTNIGNSAFLGCTSLTSITIPDGVTSIGERAFEGCASLTSITILDSVTSIGGSAFEGCSSLTSITIPDSVTSIGGDAFRDCTSLTSITIPDSVTSIGERAFSSCSSLTSVYYTGNIASWCGITFSSNPLSYAHNLYINNEIITGEIVLPNTVTTIPNYTFKNSSITSITIPDSVTSIGDNAFDGCTSLTSITIPDCVTSIGERAFYNCTSLTSVTIPDSVTSIGNSAFSGCTSLTSITIPDSVTSIGGGAFSDCPIETATIPAIACSYIDKSVLKSVTITSGTSIGEASFDGCSFTSIAIPDSVTSIGDCAFYRCTSLTSVTLGEDSKLTSIGSHAFYCCFSLTNITIPDGVTSIGEAAFYGCSFTNITIPDGVTSIEDYAFYDCTSLTSITIPDSVTSIGNSAFYNCSNLTEIVYEGTMTQWYNITFGTSWNELTGDYVVICSNGTINK